MDHRNDRDDNDGDGDDSEDKELFECLLVALKMRHAPAISGPSRVSQLHCHYFESDGQKLLLAHFSDRNHRDDFLLNLCFTMFHVFPLQLLKLPARRKS